MTGKPKMSYAKALTSNLTPLKGNELSPNILTRPITLTEQLKAQRPERQIFKRRKSLQKEQNSRPPPRNPSQTNQSDREKEISPLQAQIESLELCTNRGSI